MRGKLVYGIMAGFQKAYLVLGPESSGTRLVTRILINAGCIGSDQHTQPWDQEPFPDPVSQIVFRRSVPHGGNWPDIRDVLQRIKNRGYIPHAVIMSRDWHSIIKSQVACQHVKNEDEAKDNLGKVYPFIFNALEGQQVPYLMMTYESITLSPQTVNGLLHLLGLPVLDQEKIGSLALYDGNDKWYKD